MAKRSPVLGYNHNVKYRGIIFHVQTEDSGVGNPHVFTHLFHGGVIVSTRKYIYDPEADDGVVKALMQSQHKAVMKELKGGKFDDKIDVYLGDNPDLLPRESGADADATDVGKKKGGRKEAVPAPEAEVEDRGSEPEIQVFNLDQSDTVRIPALVEAVAAARAPEARREGKPATGSTIPPIPRRPGTSTANPGASRPGIGGEDNSIAARARPPSMPVPTRAGATSRSSPNISPDAVAQARKTERMQTMSGGAPGTSPPGSRPGLARTPSMPQGRGADPNAPYGRLPTPTEPPPAVPAPPILPTATHNLNTGGARPRRTTMPRVSAAAPGRPSGGVVMSRPAVIVGNKSGRDSAPELRRSPTAPPPSGAPPVRPGSAPAIATPERVRKAREDSQRPKFGGDLISEKSLDEVILAYLAEDAEQ